MCNHRNTVLCANFGEGDGCGGCFGTNESNNLVILDGFSCCIRGLNSIVTVVISLQFNLASEDTAGFICLIDKHFQGVDKNVTPKGSLTGERTDCADDDFFVITLVAIASGHNSEHKSCDEDETEHFLKLSHVIPSLIYLTNCIFGVLFTSTNSQGSGQPDYLILHLLSF